MITKKTITKKTIEKAKSLRVEAAVKFDFEIIEINWCSCVGWALELEIEKGKKIEIVEEEPEETEEVKEEEEPEETVEKKELKYDKEKNQYYLPEKIEKSEWEKIKTHMEKVIKYNYLSDTYPIVWRVKKGEENVVAAILGYATIEDASEKAEKKAEEKKEKEKVEREVYEIFRSGTRPSGDYIPTGAGIDFENGLIFMEKDAIWYLKSEIFGRPWNASYDNCGWNGTRVEKTSELVALIEKL